MGFILYQDFNKQPQLTNDFSLSLLEFSSNHVYSFFVISIFGLIIFLKKNIKIYLFSISIILETLHIIIPNRSFQFSDLNGNLLGVVIAITFFYIYEYFK
tara:strand:+ start:893 stop:1192 length:300 start_codon:yes stop_codon:yes gene_type:complete